MKNYNLIYDKEKNLENILDNLLASNVVVNETFSSIGVINVSSEIEDFSHIDGIIEAEEDVSINPDPAADTVEEWQWHQLRVCSRNLPMKNRFTPRNNATDVNIYLIDSGITHDHEEFENANIVDLYSYNDTFEDPTGHGTAVASVIVGKTLGISTEATLKNVKIPLNESIPLSSLLTAFNAIADDKDYEQFAVINCSWTIPKSRILDNLVAELQDQGFLIVAAAGNSISNADDLSPIGYNPVLGVGASDAFDRVISWAEGVGSNWGEEVDLFAPGIDVVVANKNGGTFEISGTSISAGIVSALVAHFIYDLDYIIENSENIITINSIGDLKNIILLNSVEDILFRNEEIYENTPNRLVLALTDSNKFGSILDQTIFVPTGSSYELIVDLQGESVSYLNIDKINLGIKTLHHPEWIQLDEETNLIHIAPPEESYGKTYLLYVQFLDENREIMGTTFYKVNIFEESDQIDQEETYHWEIGEDDQIIVSSQNNCIGQDCFWGGNCTTTKVSKGFLYCSCQGGQPWGTCNSYL